SDQCWLGVLKYIENIPITAFGTFKHLDLFDGFSGKIPDGAVRMSEKNFCPRLKDVVVTINPGVSRKRVRAEHLIPGYFRTVHVLLDRLHVGVAQSKKLAHGMWCLIREPR